jgi:hypothetical protein
MGRGVGDYKTVQGHEWIIQAGFDLFDGLVELDFGVLETYVPDAFGINKADMLMVAVNEPDNEIRVKVAGFHLVK